ncbi:MAG: PAS domain S-box protein [Verrucomicrobiaceae bacterium]|nr:MAG: PAS domain S-box protein [Verrucomicrobiaceae bacterium]
MTSCPFTGQSKGAPAPDLARVVSGATTYPSARSDLSVLQKYNEICQVLLSPDLNTYEIITRLTENSVELVGAEFGAYFQNVGDDVPEWALFAMHGAAKEAFEVLGKPRITELFQPTYHGANVVRSDDIAADARSGSMGGLPRGHLPVRSYLAVPVLRRSGTVQGALLFAHRLTHQFTEESEVMVTNLATLTAIALDNAERFESLQREVEERRRAQHLLRSVIDSVSDMIYVKDCQGRFVVANRIVEKALKSDDLVGKTDYDFAAKEFANVFQTNDAWVRENRQLLITEEILEVDGKPVVFQSSKMPWIGPNGNVIGIVGVSRDFSETKRTQETEKLLLDELNHRVKNTLATIQSLAVQTLRSTPEPEQFGPNFLGRLQGIALTHNILTEASWSGAKLEDVIRAELIPYHTENMNRWTVNGPQVELNPAATTSIGMIIHELVTNAVKYGALAVHGGHLNVDWKIGCGDDPCLNLEWIERDGPSVAMPTRSGFGTRLLKSIANQFGGTATLKYDPGGLVCVFNAPLTEITAKSSVQFSHR